MNNLKPAKRVLALVGWLSVLPGLGGVAPATAETQFGTVLRFIGVTGHAWGTWVEPGVEIEDWLDDARGYCAGEDVCEVNVFEGTELATHEYPVPDANRAALKWVLLYRHDETPRIVIEEAHAAPGQEKRRWTFDR